MTVGIFADIVGKKPVKNKPLKSLKWFQDLTQFFYSDKMPVLKRTVIQAQKSMLKGVYPHHFMK